MANEAYYREMFDLLSAPALPVSPEPTVVFGRKDQRVAAAAADIIQSGLATMLVLSGGLGKDSGDIGEEFKSEADWLLSKLDLELFNKPGQIPPILLEPRATNGGENARFSLARLTARGELTSSLTAVAHATSARRLAATLQLEASKLNKVPAIVHTKPTDYPFNPENPTDREEALAEFMRLVTWPKKGWLTPQLDLPTNLVDFAVNQGVGAPPRPSAMAGHVLRAIPGRPRIWLLNRLK